MVSPQDKNGYPVFQLPEVTAGMAALSADGDRAIYTSFGSFADSESGMPSTYLASRGREAWTTRIASPGAVIPAPNVVTGTANMWRFADPELTTGVLWTDDSLDPGDAFRNLDVYVDRPAGVEWQSQGNAGEHGDASSTADIGGVSRDLRTVLFLSDAHLVPSEDAGRVDGRDLYARNGGHTYLINRDSNGDLLGACGSTAGSDPVTGSVRNAVSDDSRRIFFSVPGGAPGADPDCGRPTQIYARVDFARTIAISASQRRVLDPGGQMPALFAGASRSGTEAFFTSTEMLTDDAPVGGGLYGYDLTNGRLSLLVPGSVEVAKISDSGRLVTFLATGDLVPGRSVVGARNLYLLNRDAGVLRWIGDDDNTGRLGNLTGYAEVTRPLDVNDSGSVAFATTAPLTGYDNSSTTCSADYSPLCSEVFVYSYERDSLTCVSCDPAGQRPQGSQVVSDSNIVSFRGGTPNASFSADARYLLFESGDRLVTEDTNDRRDAYEYVDGRVELVSSGHSANDSYAVGISASGQTIMFATYESLLPVDTDGGNQDMYVARDGGGFSSQERVNDARCVGDSCQGPLAPIEDGGDTPGSEQLISPPNSGGEGTAPVARVTIATPRANARLSVGAPGVVRITLRAIGKLRLEAQLVRKARTRTIVVARESRRISSAESKTYTVRLSLSKVELVRLRREHQMRVRLRVLRANGKVLASVPLVLLVKRGGRR